MRNAQRAKEAPANAFQARTGSASPTCVLARPSWSTQSATTTAGVTTLMRSASVRRSLSASAWTARAKAATNELTAARPRGG